MRFQLSRIKPWQWIVLVLIALAAAAGGYVVLRTFPIREWIDRISSLGRVPFLAALAILPALGVPVSPFYLLAGRVLGGNGPAIVGCVCAITVNVALTYVLGRWVLHPVAVRLVAKLGYHIPIVRREDRWALTLLLRITPGPPFFVQSYLLALAGVPFGVYMVVSVCVSAPLGVGVIVLGESLMQGRSGGIILGVSMLAAGMLAVRIVRKSLRRRKELAAVEEAETAPVAESGESAR